MADIELIIKISEDVYTRLFDNGIQDNEIAVDDICEMARALRLGIPIPDNATNDDVLKALFDERGYMGIHDRMMHTKWLSAPYQKGGK